MNSQHPTPTQRFDRGMRAGTNHQRQSLRNAQITAIDISTNSPPTQQENHKTNMRMLGSNNGHPDINQLRESYDVIECSNVLHHMQNPAKAWQLSTATKAEAI